MIGVGCMEITAIEKEYVNRVLESGLITAGPVLEQFERRFASAHGCRQGLMLNSGTDALRIALAALKEANDWTDDDEVIVPALTFIATANIVLQNNMVPVFVDVDAQTFNMDPSKIEKAISLKTKAIIPVHLFGLPCDMEPILDIARGHGLKVIEDSCEAMGVKYKGRPVGSFGDIACFSTYAAHVISTGVGGLAITNDDELAILMKSYANHGRDPRFLGFRDSRPLNPGLYLSNRSRVDDIVANRFSFDRIGWSSRATQMEAAIGLAQLERLDEIIFQRANNFAFLQTQLLGVAGITLQQTPSDCEHAAMMFPIVLLADGPSRQEVTTTLEQEGIETRPFFNILNQPPYRAGFDENAYPHSKFLSRQGFYVGCHQLLAPTELWKIVDSVKAAVSGRKAVA
jgi:dTDP-4-amino-4,6-dideoxygalactose transaminase